MKHTVSRFTLQPNKDFPLDADGLNALQTNLDMLAVLGNLAGDKAILCGCEPENNGVQRRPGYVFIRTKEYPNGEVLYWEGGSTTSGMYLRKQPIPITAYGYEYPQAYIERSLAPGIGEENYKWADFSTVTIPQLCTEIAKLQQQVENIHPAPLGIVELWAGQNAPDNYALCDGRAFKRNEYPVLFTALGTQYNTGYDCDGRRYKTDSDSFRLPDLRGRFVVGQHSADVDYDTQGSVGGKKKHSLTIEEMPAHKHTLQWHALTDGGDSHAMGDGSTPAMDNTASVGGNVPHENRPPYYTLAYIMKLK